MSECFIGWAANQPSGGLVDSVFTRTGAVAAQAGDYTAAQITSTGPSNVQADLDALLLNLGTAKIIKSQDDLQAAFPNVAGVHTINLPTLWTAPPVTGLITLLAGRSISVVHPGSINALGTFKVTIEGDVALPLVDGEVVGSGVVIRNVNAAGSDVRIESLFGRPIVLDNVSLAGANPGVIENIFGGISVDGVLQPPAIAASKGLTFSGTIGNAVLGLFGQAPGVSAYTLMTFDATVVVANLLDIVGCQLNASAGDYLVKLDASATFPTGALPTVIVGARVSGCMISGTAGVFDPAGLDDADIEVIASNNTGGRSSAYLADVAASTGANPTIALTHTGAGVDDIIPYDNSSNTGAGPTLVTLTALAVQERYSLDLTNPSPVIWHVRLDGPARVLNGSVAFVIELSKSAGASAEVTAVIMRSIALGAFLPIESSRTEELILVAAPRRVSGKANIRVNNGDRFAVAVRTDTPATITEITLIELAIPGTP